MTKLSQSCGVESQFNKIRNFDAKGPIDPFVFNPRREIRPPVEGEILDEKGRFLHEPFRKMPDRLNLLPDLNPALIGTPNRIRKDGKIFDLIGDRRPDSSDSPPV